MVTVGKCPYRAVVVRNWLPKLKATSGLGAEFLTITITFLNFHISVNGGSSRTGNIVSDSVPSTVLSHLIQTYSLRRSERLKRKRDTAGHNSRYVKSKQPSHISQCTRST